VCSLGSGGSTDCHSNDTSATSSLDITTSGCHETAVIILPRSELDRANKDKRHYPDDFEVSQ